MADVRLAAKKRKLQSLASATRLHIVSPGDIITEDTGYMRGHGTFVEDDKLKASVAGIVERVNKLICVKPLKTRYYGEVGDVVVGRITEVGQRRWKVETYSRMDSVLLLSSVNLPGGELRRKSVKDELMMREFFAEGDLISAEVQSLFADGSLSLHTRSLKYGKLLEGTLVTVPPSHVKRCKTHFHNLPCGASIILGNNGFIWIGPLVENSEEKDEQPLQPEASSFDREVIARLRNCIAALSDHGVLLFDTSVLLAYDASLKYQVKDILKPEIQEEIVDITRQTLLLQES